MKPEAENTRDATKSHSANYRIRIFGEPAIRYANRAETCFVPFVPNIVSRAKVTAVLKSPQIPE
jgi:hypothetical protein